MRPGRKPVEPWGTLGIVSRCLPSFWCIASRLSKERATRRSLVSIDAFCTRSRCFPICLSVAMTRSSCAARFCCMSAMHRSSMSRGGALPPRKILNESTVVDVRFFFFGMVVSHLLT
jgi:hypothetical protein